MIQLEQGDKSNFKENFVNRLLIAVTSFANDDAFKKEQNRL